MTNKQTIKQGRNLYPYPNNNNNNNKDTNSTNNTTITKRPWKTEQMNRVASRRVALRSVLFVEKPLDRLDSNDRRISSRKNCVALHGCSTRPDQVARQ